MDFLREEIARLKNLGHDWEMDKHHIEEAIMKALAGQVKYAQGYILFQNINSTKSLASCYYCCDH